MPPKQPYWPPSSTSTGTPAPRSRSTARMISEMAIRPALASCRRTPPDSTSSRTASGHSSRARSSRPTILAPWTSPTAPPMKAPSWAANKHAPASNRATPDDHAVIEGGGRVELAQMRADHALLWRQELLEAARIEQGLDPAAGGVFVPAVGHDAPPV